MADERHELFRKPFRREAIFECIEVCALLTKRGHFGAECVHFGPQAIRHDEMFIEVVRFRINAFLYVAVHVRALSRVRLLGKVFLIQECHSRMCEGMNLCPIIAAGMSSCFPLLSVGGGWCYITSFAACPCVGLERWLLKAISFLIIRGSIQLSLICSALRTVKTAPHAL